VGRSLQFSKRKKNSVQLVFDNFFELERSGGLQRQLNTQAYPHASAFCITPYYLSETKLKVVVPSLETLSWDVSSMIHLETHYSMHLK
jgi:hypothetical protein